MARVCIFATVLLLAASIALAQKPAFEVASIKPNTSGQDGGSLGPRGNRLVATNVTLRSLLTFAYAPPNGTLLYEQLVETPEWANTDHLDIEAKAEGEGAVPIQQMRLMLQSLLEDRFQLKAHRENRDLPVFNLVLTKRGPTPSADQTPPDPSRSSLQFSSSAENQSALPRGAMRITKVASGTTLAGNAITVSRLVTLLQGQSDRMILDKTGFTSLFDINFAYTSAAQASESSAPLLSTAIQDIGLKLEPAKAPVEVLVVDSVHKPSAN
jgi:uncharacterized protein (TIGR03435 family)